jgi:cytochrome c oxidase subunit 3
MTAIDSHDAGHDHDHPPFLAHHWESPQQQFEAGKLGMWLFLATEFLLFGGLFCAYAVFRFNHPEIFAYGSKFLNTFWGATNTVVLILSSLTMAMAVTAAQQGLQRRLVTLLSFTVLGGAIFMGIKYVEYKHKFEHHIQWGTTFYVPPHHGDGHAAGDEGAHEEAGEEGDHDEAAGDGEHAVADAAAAAEGDEPGLDDEMGDDGFLVTRSTVAPAAQGPSGLAPRATRDGEEEQADEAPTEPDPRTDPDRPANAHIFFGIYFLMTGLHGIHVLAGMGVITWLIVRSARGDFGPEYFTPVDLGGLYWHVVDLIWIFLFPLLYLIA